MHIGMAAVFQNTGRALTDHQIYLNELALADMAEPLGFESLQELNFRDAAVEEGHQRKSSIAQAPPSENRNLLQHPG